MSDNIETNDIIPLNEENSNVTFFKKKTKINKNVRKRKQSPSAEEEEGSAVITKERKLDTSNPFVQNTRKENRTEKEGIGVTFTASKSAVSSIPHDVATRTAEWETETDRDAQAMLEKKLAAEEVFKINTCAFVYIFECIRNFICDGFFIRWMITCIKDKIHIKLI